MQNEEKRETKKPAGGKARRKRKQRLRLSFDDVSLTFQGVVVQFDPDQSGLSEREAELVESVLESMFGGFTIDKSYVVFPENVHEDAFVELPDWQWTVAAVQIPRDMRTDFQSVCLQQAYEMLVLGYAYRTLESFGLGIDKVELSLAASPFIVETRFDAVREWKQYADWMASFVAQSQGRLPASGSEEAKKKPQQKRKKKKQDPEGS